MEDSKWLSPRITTVGHLIPNNPEKINMNKLMLEIPCAKENKYIFYCPCYLRIWIDNFTEVKIEELTAQLRITIKFDLDVTGIFTCIFKNGNSYEKGEMKSFMEKKNTHVKK